MDPGDLQRGFAGELSTEFRFVSDTSRNLSVLYGAAENSEEISTRMSVLVDRDGTVRWIDREVQIFDYGTRVLEKMNDLKIIP